MTAGRWDFSKIWPALRDVASFVLGARWGDQLMSTPPEQTAPWAWLLVAGCLGLPFVAWADRLRLQQREEAVSSNGLSPVESERPV